MISFLLWKWSDKNWQSTYTAEHVNIMADCIRRNYKRPHKIYCITDDSAGIRRDINIIPIWNHAKELGHCYRRLFAFSREFAEMMPEKFCSIDLDCVITGDITELVDSAGDFAIMKDGIPQQPYNGSFWVHQPGTRVDVWDKFIADPQGMIAQAKKAGFLACDQAIMAVIMGKSEKVFTEADGVYSYKFGVKKLGGLPANAKLIALHGNPKPWDKVGQALPWVQEHYGYTQRAIVIGGGANVWQELEALGNIKDSASIIAINDAGYAYPGKLDLWVTLHPQKMPAWIQKRKEAGFNMDFVTVGHGEKPQYTDEVSLCWRSEGRASGSSGLYACQVALEKGFEEIILCGVPMNGDKNIFRGKEWSDFVGYRQAWKEHVDKLKGKVYSQSGWTKDLLGSFI